MNDLEFLNGVLFFLMVWVYLGLAVLIVYAGKFLAAYWRHLKRRMTRRRIAALMGWRDQWSRIERRRINNF